MSQLDTWRTRAIKIDDTADSVPAWRTRATRVANTEANLRPAPHTNTPQEIVDYLAPGGVPDDLLDIGVTPGTAARWADLHLQQATRENMGRPLPMNRQMAIFDIYKRMAGRPDVSSRNFVREQHEAALRKRRETLGGRLMDAGAAYNRSLATTGTSLLGTVAPGFAADLQQNIDAAYATDPDSRAAFAGGLAAEGVKLGAAASIGRLTGHPVAAMAGLYGAQGFGGTRVRADQMRESGQDVSTLAEFGTAAGVGGVEAASGAIGARIFGTLGTQLQKLGPSIARAFGVGGQAGGQQAIRRTVGSALTASGLVLAEGAEEGVTQLVTNKIVQEGMDPDQALMEGVGEAALMGMILAPLGAGAIGGMQPHTAEQLPSIEDAIAPEADAPVGPLPENRQLPPPPARFTVDPEGGTLDRTAPPPAVPTGRERFEARQARGASPETVVEAGAPDGSIAPTPRPRANVVAPLTEGEGLILTDRAAAEQLVSQEMETRLNDEEVQALVEQGMEPTEAIRTIYGTVPEVVPGTGVMEGTFTARYLPTEAATEPVVRPDDDIMDVPDDRLDPQVRELRDYMQQAVGPNAKVRIMDAPPEGIRGFYDPETKTAYIAGQDSKEAVVETLIHETMHASGLDLESTLGNSRLVKAAEQDYLRVFEQMAKANPDNAELQQMWARLQENPNERRREAVATLAGRLANDPTFAAQLSRRSPGFVQKIVNLIRRAVNTITGKQKAIDTLARDFLKRIEQNTGITGEDAGFLPADRPMQRTRAESHQRDLAELVGKRSRATGPEAQKRLDRDIDQKRETIKTIKAEEGPSFLPSGLRKPGVSGTPGGKGRFTLPQGIEDFITPISTRLMNISPTIYRRLIQFEMRSRVQREDLQRAASEFLRNKNEKLSKAQRKEFDLHVFNGDFDKARTLLQSADPSLVAGFRGIENLLNGVHAAATRAGIETGFIDNYWPREVRDYAEWRKQIRGDEPAPIRDAIDLQESRLGRQLTPGEEIELVNHVLQGYGPRKPGETRPKSFRTRTQATLTPDMLDLYHNADHALMGYINRATHAIEKARFFGKGTVGDDILNSIGRWTAELVASGDITADQEREVKSLLASRFTTGEASPSGLVKSLRDIGYITTLANSISTITQIGDLFLAGYKNGIIPALRSVGARKRIKMESLGIERIAAEFIDPSKLARVLDACMKAAGFTSMDRLGKETFLNSSLRKYMRAARSPASQAYKAFESQYRPIFGAEFDGIVADLKADKITENVRLLLFMELSGVQPITLSEMPKKYLDAPNGRIFYMLKTFTIKQLDLIRRDAFAKINRGDLVGGAGDLLRFAMIFGLGNAGADLLKDWILGRDVKWTDLAIDGVLRLFGGSKFLMDASVKDGPGRMFFSMLMPPTTMFDDAAKDVLEIPDIWAGDKGVTTVRNIPLFGKILYWRFGEGGQKLDDKRRAELRKREKEVRKLAVDALDLKDLTSARAIIKKWNQEEKPGWMEDVTLRSVSTSRRARKKTAFNKARDTAAEALLAGDRSSAAEVIEEYNQANPGHELTLRHAEIATRRMAARGRTE